MRASKVVFSNPGLISVLDLTTMGDSSKKNNSFKIGKFDSGLKYALAILYRNNVEVKIVSGDTTFTLDSEVLKDSVTGKEKEVLVIVESPKPEYEIGEGALCSNCKGTNYGDASNNSIHYQCEGAYCDETYEEYLESLEIRHITGFSPQLGHDWELWMAIRELYSNMKDEGGSMFTCDYFGMITDNTYIVIHITEEINKILDNFDDYFLPKSAIKIGSYSTLKVFKNTGKYIKIYKQGILIYENIDIESLYMYEWGNADIDERRILSNFHEFKNMYDCAFRDSSNEELIVDFFVNVREHHMESSMYIGEPRGMLAAIINKALTPTVIETLPENIKVSLSSAGGIDVGIRRIKTFEPDYSYSTATVSKMEVELTFEEEIQKKCKTFNIGFPVVKSTISGKLKVLPDMYKKVIYVSEDFTEEDRWEIIRASFRLQFNDNLTEAPYKELDNFYK